MPRSGLDERTGGRRQEVTVLRCGTKVLSPQAVLQEVAKHYRLPVGRLPAKGERSLEARNVAMWLTW